MDIPALLTRIPDSRNEAAQIDLLGLHYHALSTTTGTVDAWIAAWEEANDRLQKVAGDRLARDAGGCDAQSWAIRQCLESTSCASAHLHHARLEKEMRLEQLTELLHQLVKQGLIEACEADRFLSELENTK